MKTYLQKHTEIKLIEVWDNNEWVEYSCRSHEGLTKFPYYRIYEGSNINYFRVLKEEERKTVGSRDGTRTTHLSKLMTSEFEILEAFGGNV